MRDYRVINPAGNISRLMSRREAYSVMNKVRATELSIDTVITVIDRKGKVIFTRTVKGY